MNSASASTKPAPAGCHPTACFSRLDLRSMGLKPHAAHTPNCSTPRGLPHATHSMRLIARVSPKSFNPCTSTPCEPRFIRSIYSFNPLTALHLFTLNNSLAPTAVVTHFVRLISLGLEVSFPTPFIRISTNFPFCLMDKNICASISRNPCSHFLLLPFPLYGGKGWG